MALASAGLALLPLVACGANKTAAPAQAAPAAPQQVAAARTQELASVTKLKSEAYTAARAGQFTYLVPVWSLLFAVLFLGERPAPLQLVGAAVVLAGLWLSNRVPAGAQR